MEEKHGHADTSPSKEEFLSTVAHQMGTSLTAMKWTLHELEETPSVAGDSAAKEYVENMIISNGRLIRLARNLLHVARTEAINEETKHDFKPLEIDTVIHHLVTTLSPTAKKRGVTLAYQPSESPLKVNADRDALTLIIENLIDNAIKYSIKATNPLVNIDVKEKGINAVITVTDNGIGIAQKDQEHIFEKFFRASNTEEHKIKGTGLGLFIVKRMIEEHGGTLTFESVEGEGATFHVTIPLLKEES